ncbi:MAG: hypothetical protein JNJ55_06380, partial [Betaproteobacteria bacterium]|nr:hypothetical protein [Betaproteobacteria bacterium]
MTGHAATQRDPARWPIRPSRAALQAATVGVFAACGYAAAMALLNWPAWGFVAVVVACCALGAADAVAAWGQSRRVGA